MKLSENFFTTWDGTRLFYRAWLPETPQSQGTQKALLLFHRGHEHSGRFEEIAQWLAASGFAVFAYDARGHGRSPGDRGWAPGFSALVRDADCFAREVVREYGLRLEEFGVLAHSIGAVVAAAWVHDYAPPIRALILASPAFRVKLYVPFALSFLRLRLRMPGKAFVQSYVRPAMLTHDPGERQKYAGDALISRSVAVQLLVEMHDTSTRLLADAAALRTPTLVLSAGKDYVVELAPQRRFFRDLASPLKQMREFPGCYHDLLHERERDQVWAEAARFLSRAFEQPAEDRSQARNQDQYQRLSRPSGLFAPSSWNWGAQRLFLKTAGRLSRGIRLGWRYGFDSGESLDYVYRNEPYGPSFPGRLIDRVYLNAPGWRGVRQRKSHIESLLRGVIAELRARGRTVHIFDPAAGRGRYVLETVSRMGKEPITVTLHDSVPFNVAGAGRLSQELGLQTVTVRCGDAFDPAALAAIRPRPDIVIVSGLYELFSDNQRVRESLRGLAAAVADDGYLIYTNQPWHPQLAMIARVLDNREGKRWVMRCRPQAEMDALVAGAGFEKLETRVAGDGIFTVTLARRRAQPAAARAQVAPARAAPGSNTRTY